MADPLEALRAAFSCMFNDFHAFSCIFNDVHAFSCIFIIVFECLRYFSQLEANFAPGSDRETAAEPQQTQPVATEHRILAGRECAPRHHLWG